MKGMIDIMKITATKHFNFACAHLLTGHLGLCKNLHGHNYDVEVTMEHVGCGGDLRTAGPSEGMVIDFKDIKHICNTVFDKYDHAFVVDERTVYSEEESAEKALFEVALDNDLKVVCFPTRPTAENMSIVFADELNGKIKKAGLPCRVVKVRVWETPTSHADWEA